MVSGSRVPFMESPLRLSILAAEAIECAKARDTIIIVSLIATLLSLDQVL